MKGKVLSVVIISGIMLTSGVANAYGKGDQFKILKNVNAIESQQELKMEKIKGYNITDTFQEDGFIVEPEVSRGEAIKEILIKGVKNQDDQSIDVSSLNARSILSIHEFNGYLYLMCSPPIKNSAAPREVKTYKMNMKSKEIRDISSYIKGDEVFYQYAYDDKKNLILANWREGKVRSVNKDFKEIQNIQLPIKKGENDIYYDNNLISIKEEDGHITKIYFKRIKTKKNGFMGFDEELSEEAYVYDVNAGVEKILPFKETILSIEAKNGRIFIEEKRGDHVYLTQKDEMGRTLNEEYLYNRKKGYSAGKLEICPNGEFAVLQFARTFEDINKGEIHELYLIDMKNHKKIKLMAVEQEEGSIGGAVWSKNGKRLGIHLRNRVGEGEDCIIKIEDVL